jgi:cytochrome c
MGAEMSKSHRRFSFNFFSILNGKYLGFAVGCFLPMLAMSSEAEDLYLSGSDCPNPAETDFALNPLVTRQGGNLNEPLRMAFDMNSQGEVDIYFVEKAGKLRKYDAVTKAVINLGTISVRTTGEHGLLGIALDPGFKANKRLYLFYGAGQGTYEFRLSRFTLTGNTLDMASEKIMLRIPADNNQWHTGGALLFDNQGNLWVTIGDNKSDEGGSPNTNSLLGKILRIHPLEDGSYSIPEGNLFPVGTLKTRSEIYIMGNRNPYSIAIDPLKGSVAWGEVGPDGFGPTEEFNVTSKPGNFGWPYFAGNNMNIKGGKDAKAPVNSSPLNTGLTTLPAAIPGSYVYNQSAAITGPIYRYDASPNTPFKMPPQFDGLWFVTDFNGYGGMGGTIDTLNSDPNAPSRKLGRIFPKWKLASPTDFQVGPDGAFYAVNYAGYFSTVDNTAIVRIEYKGTCRPISKYSTSLASNQSRISEKWSVKGLSVQVWIGKESVLEVRDLAGRSLFNHRVRVDGEYALPEGFKQRPGLYLVSLITGTERQTKQAFLGP